MFSPSSAQAALLAKYGPLPIFIPDFANLQIVQGLNMTERLTPPYGVRISPTFGIALGDTFKHNTTSFSSEITSISCAAAGAVGAFNFQYTDGTYIEANAGTAPTSSAVALLPEEYINGVSGYATSSQITSLHFSTSRRNITCGTGTEGSRFETEIPDGSRAVGFFGTANGGAVTSFGVQYAKLPALRTLANDASNITVTVFEPQLLITPGAANMWETNDQTALNAAKALAAKELSPIYDNIIENGNEAWVEAVPDPATNATFYISLGAPDAGGTAPAIWVYAIPVTVPGANITLAVHIGTFSPAGGFGSAHPHIIEGLAIGTEAAAVLAAIGGIVKWYNTYTALVTNAGTVLDAELDAIFQEATYTSALAEFFGVDAVTFNLLAASASAFPIGAIAIAIIVSVAFIIEKLDRDYSLAVNVYNFDPVNQWVVDDWASNNGDTSGGPFTTAVLAALNNTVDGPAGPLPTVKWAATWATYLFGNKDTIGDGVYIAMQAELGTAGSGEGFTFGYRIHATTEDNQMALMDGLTDLETFVNSADGVWHQAEALTIVNQATGQTIYANSPALSGVKNSSYILDIGIGLPRSSVTPPSGPSAPGFGQCGGQGWTGATSCVSGYVCTVDSAFFSQCLPAASTTTTTSSAPSSAPTAPQFGQCGGTDWTGATSCVLGYVCTMVNVFFSQCQPPPVLTGTPIPAFGQCGGVGWTGNSTCIAGYFCGLEGAFAPYPICLQLNNTTTTATTLLTQASSSSPSTHPTTTVSTVTQTSSSATSTRASTTSSSHATSTPTPTGTQAPAFGQCGGTGWTGATACIVGYVCIRANAFFSQCLPQ